MNTTKKILHDAIDSLKSDDAAGLKKHVAHALLLKIRQAVRDEKKNLAKRIFKGAKI